MGHSQLHDEVEVAPTLIDVIQGYNVGVLDPKKRNEVVYSLRWLTTPQHLHLGQDTKVLEPTGEKLMLEGKKEEQASTGLRSQTDRSPEIHTQNLPLPCATWKVVFALCSSDGNVASNFSKVTPLLTSRP